MILLSLLLPTSSLEDAFNAFAECVRDDATSAKLAHSLSFFAAAGARSEEDVRSLPELLCHG